MTTNPQWEAAVDGEWRGLIEIRTRALGTHSEQRNDIQAWVLRGIASGLFQSRGGWTGGQFQVRRANVVATPDGFIQCRPLKIP